MGHRASPTTTQFCCWSIKYVNIKHATGNMSTNGCGCVPKNFISPKRQLACEPQFANLADTNSCSGVTLAKLKNTAQKYQIDPKDLNSTPEQQRPTIFTMSAKNFNTEKIIHNI